MLAPGLALGLSLALLSSPVQAHDRDMATFELRELDAGWMLSLQVATAAVDEALREQGELGEAKNDRKAYEEAFVSYLEQHIELASPAGAVMLGPGAVRLGPHQSDFVFELHGLEAGAEQLRVHIDAFAGPEQVNALRVRPRVGHHLRYMLREDNGYAASWPAQPGVVLEGGEPAHGHDHAHDHEDDHEHADDHAHEHAPAHTHTPHELSDISTQGREETPSPRRPALWLLGLGFGLGFSLGLSRLLMKRPT